MHNHVKCHKPKHDAGVAALLVTLLSGAVCTLLCPQASAAKPDPAQIRHGEMLVLSLGCNDCHTPLKMGAHGPEPDMSRMLSGHPQQLKLPPPPKTDAATWAWVGSASNTAFAGPWGISYAANLTADPDTGLGKWTEQMFITAIKTGKHLGTSRPIMPPMPWQAYSHLSEKDLKAVFAYLRSIPVIHNQPPYYAPPQVAEQEGAAR
jgi:mono/diheme cytochrome c family protein